ncbi:phosphoadenosine phosphosulfate reductase [Pseudomonas sp. BN415]|uniref:phosphoadenosine phosphosulfate reductase family protein n=1 Tax=Pseudomonas sp. BN415 TaxID=2567889 RepID=UPI002455553C|nr:phosphoadenosine phosphosulfate reductase family protein [Pseudomonas sp. BN415]MDH4585608.1 phosphoadenosine phosphosulfate reductase [Pseudomonas sp. BN415]
MIEYNITSLSAGKDSLAAALLMKEREVENGILAFADTGNEHELTYEYLDYLESVLPFPLRRVRADFTAAIAARRQMMLSVIAGTHKERTNAKYHWTPETAERALSVLHPTGIPFLDMCLVHGRFPSTKVKFCTIELKIQPMEQQIQNPLLTEGHDIMSWQGVRADESPDRASLVELEWKLTNRASGAELWHYRPIHKWTAEQVFEIARRHGIKPNPLYLMGMSRVGCMPCINAGKNEILEISRRFPQVIDQKEAWEANVSMSSKTRAATFFPARDLGARNAAAIDPSKHGIRGRVEWSKTSRGGTQYDMLRSDSPTELCSSIYGLCE